MEPNPAEKKETVSIVIEKATIADLSEIQRLNQALCTKENAEFDSTIDPNYPFTPGGEEYFRLRIESGKGLAILAKEGDQVVAYLVAGIAEPEDYRMPAKVVELENMFVDESMRGKGVGGKLIQRFEEWSREVGADRTRIIASSANAGAIKFYESHGAKPVSVVLEKDLRTQ